MKVSSVSSHSGIAMRSSKHKVKTSSVAEKKTLEGATLEKRFQKFQEHPFKVRRAPQFFFWPYDFYFGDVPPSFLFFVFFVCVILSKTRGPP